MQKTRYRINILQLPTKPIFNRKRATYKYFMNHRRSSASANSFYSDKLYWLAYLGDSYSCAGINPYLPKSDNFSKKVCVTKVNALGCVIGRAAAANRQRVRPRPEALIAWGKGWPELARAKTFERKIISCNFLFWSCGVCLHV